jgi:beta-carotene 3-hydroxylase
VSSVLHRLVVWLPCAVLSALAMELWAGLLHGRVWHGALWPIHRSHHARRRGRFEANDVLSALHAPVAVTAIVYGCVGPSGWVREVVYGAGIGMSAFGLSYAIVHDGLVHGRLPVRGLLRWRYFREVARAHRVHHAGVEGARPFGLFLGPRELARHGRVTGARLPPSDGLRPGPSDRPPRDRARA